MSQDAEHPCPDVPWTRPGAVENGQDPTAPGHLPVNRLNELFDRMAENYAWMVRAIGRRMWAKQPEPVAACQILGELSDGLAKLVWDVAELQRHVDLLWELSHDEAERRRQPQPPKRSAT